jgi:hypothetical protein
MVFGSGPGKPLLMEQGLGAVFRCSAHGIHIRVSCIFMVRRFAGLLFDPTPMAKPDSHAVPHVFTPSNQVILILEDMLIDTPYQNSGGGFRRSMCE